MYSYGPPHLAEQKQDDQHEHTFSNYVRIWDVVQKTCQRRWTFGKSGERGSGISVLPARHDDDDDILSTQIYIQGVPKNVYRLEVIVCTFLGHPVYIVIYRQTISLYHKSSVWLYTLDYRSWDRNPFNSNANSRFYHSATRKLE